MKSGNLLLARDKRYDEAYDQPMKPAQAYQLLKEGERELVKMQIGQAVFLDYASAGSTWDDQSAFSAFVTFLSP